MVTSLDSGLEPYLGSWARRSTLTVPLFTQAGDTVLSSCVRPFTPRRLGSLYWVLGQDTLLSQCLCSPRLGVLCSSARQFTLTVPLFT